MPRESTYPWEIWFDGNEHVLQKGVDFQGDITSIKNHIYTTAKRKGKNISVSEQEGILIIKPRVVVENLPVVFDNIIEGEIVVSESREYNVDKWFAELQEKGSVTIKYGKDYSVTSMRLLPKIYDEAVKRGLDISNWEDDVKATKITIFIKSGLNQVFISNSKLVKCEQWLNDLAEAQDEIDYKQVDEVDADEAKFADEIHRKVIIREVTQKFPVKDEKGELVYEWVHNEELSRRERVIKMELKTVLSKDVITEEFELIYPNDFSCSPKKAVDLILEAGRNKGLDVNEWRFDIIRLNKLQKKLKIYTGNAAKKIIEENENAFGENIKSVWKITNNQIIEWEAKLKQEPYSIQLFRYRDFPCTAKEATIRLKVILEKRGIILGSIRPDGDSVIVTLRRVDEMAEAGILKDTPNNKIWHRRYKEETGAGKKIEQPEEKRKREIEEQQKQKQIEEQQEKEEQARVEGQQQITSQPRIYTIPELQQKIALAKQKNNVTALRIFREKLAALGGKEDV